MGQAIGGMDLYYFSGTGNTLLAAREMQKTFGARGIECRLRRIESSDPAKADPERALGLGFPIAAFTTYPLVWDFVSGLPQAQGTPVFAFATMAGMSLCALGPLKRMLSNKGYRSVGAKQFIMPSNLWIKKYNPRKTEKQIVKALAKVRRFANDLADGRAKWVKFPLMPDLFFPLLRSRHVWRSTPGYVKLNPGKCTNCALCLELCPAGAIQLNSDVRITDKCQFCLRCISHCPQEALYYSKDQYQRYRPVKAEDLITIYD
jgi:ferredoxin/flavodoxin